MASSKLSLLQLPAIAGQEREFGFAELNLYTENDSTKDIASQLQQQQRQQQQQQQQQEQQQQLPRTSSSSNEIIFGENEGGGGGNGQETKVDESEGIYSVANDTDNGTYTSMFASSPDNKKKWNMSDNMAEIVSENNYYLECDQSSNNVLQFRMWII